MDPTQDIILGKTHHESHNQIIVRNNMAFTIHNSRVVGSQPVVWLKVPPNRDPIQFYENAVAQRLQSNSVGSLVRVDEWINDLELAAKVYVAQKKLPAFLDYEKSFRNSLRLGRRRRSRLKRQEEPSPSTSSGPVGFYGGGPLSESASPNNSCDEKLPTQNHDESNVKIVEDKNDSWSVGRVTTSPIIIDDETELNETSVNGSHDEDSERKQKEPKNNHHIPVNNKQIQFISNFQQVTQECPGIIVIDENADKSDDNHDSEINPNLIIACPSSANNREVNSKETEMETIESDGIGSFSPDSRVQSKFKIERVESLMECVSTSTAGSCTLLDRLKNISTKQLEETVPSNQHSDLPDEGDQTKRSEQDSRNNCIENINEYGREETDSLLKKGIRECFVLLNKTETCKTELSPISAVSVSEESDIRSDGEVIRIDDSEDEVEDSTASRP